ncbi:MAG: hypothetical protein ACLGHL_08445 [Actinomycetota bacterium]
MVIAASDLTGWWIGYGVGAAVVLIVATVVISLIVTARRIGDVAEDATRSLAETRDRTEVLWQVAVTNQVATELLTGAREARRALAGEPSDQGEPVAATPGRRGLGGSTSGLVGEPPGGDGSGGES